MPLRFSEYNEHEIVRYFLNVRGIFERAEMTSRAGAKRSRAHRKVGVCYTTFRAKNETRILVETRCEDSKHIYIISTNGKSSEPYHNRDNALKHIESIGGYLPKKPPDIIRRRREALIVNFSIILDMFTFSGLSLKKELA
jgi:hypothetical protein